MKILLTGDRVSADQAEKIGLIEYLVDDGQELDVARGLAHQIAQHSTVATQAVKAAVRSALDLTVAQGLKYENELMSLCFAKVEQSKLRNG